MSGNNTKSRILAISLALIMLVSMGGTAFVGGAAAQSQTGGTFDTLFDDTSNVGDKLNVPSNNVSRLNSSGSTVDIRSDGRVDIDGTNDDGEFAGISFSLDYIDSKTSADLSSNISSGNYADLLDQVPAEYNVSVNSTADANNATPAIFIELDPESDFSQINQTDGNIPDGTDDVQGNHDYIIVAPANQTDAAIDKDSQLLGLTDSDADINASAANVDDIVALSVENDGTEDADSSLIANGSNFGETLSNLTGNSETDLQNKYIDGVTFAAGTFDDPAVTIEEVKLGDNIAISNSETIHSEKIELDNGSTSTYHSSINGSLAELTVDGDDEVRLAGGTYGAIEPNRLDIASNVTITNQSDLNVGSAEDRINTTAGNVGFESSSEPVINATLNLTGATTVSNIGLNASDPVVNISADDTTLENVVVNSTSTGAPAIEVNNSITKGVSNGTNGTTIIDSAIVSEQPTSFSGGTGLQLNATGGSFDGANLSTNFDDISDNYFVGFETQVTGVNQSEATEIFNNNNFGEEVDDPVFDSTGGNASQYADTHLSQAAVPFNGSDVNATVPNSGKDSANISGSIDAGDNAAGDGDVITVTGGTYDGENPVTITTSNVEVSGAGPAATEIDGDSGVVLDNANTIAVSGFNATEGNVTSLDESNVTISDVELPAASANVSIQQAYSVNVTGVTLSDARTDVINITDTLEGDLTVADTTASNVTGGSALGNSSQTAISVGSNVTVESFDVTANDSVDSFGSVDGINLTEIAANNGSVTITDSTLTGLGDGLGIGLNQSRDEEGYDYQVDVVNNELRSNGTQFVGIKIDLPNLTKTVTKTDLEQSIDYDQLAVGSDDFGTASVPIDGLEDFGEDDTLADLPGAVSANRNGNISNNEIIGNGLSNANSVGIVAENASYTQEDADSDTKLDIGAGSVNSFSNPTSTAEIATRIRNNEISGFNRTLESKSDFAPATFDSIVSSNTLGTLVYDTSAGYNSTFGSTYNGAGDVDGYIPGSVDAAVKLINTSEASTSTLEVNDPSNVASGPQVYNATSTLSFPDSDGITLRGESTDIEVRSNISISAGTAQQDHTVRDLTLNHTNSGPALNVTSANADPTFDNLVVESDGEGLNVTSPGDVNVVTLTDSTLNVDTNGVVLDSGADDRDGFVIHNNEIRSTDGDLTSDTGLNLSALDQPGEAGEDRTDLTGLNVTDNYIAGFQTQVEMPASSEANITALNFTSSQFGDSFEIDTQLEDNNLDTDSIDLGNNEFGQQVLVFDTTPVADPANGSSDPADGDYANVSLNDTNLYGSIDEAVSEAGADSTNVTVRVYDTGELYGSPASSPTTYEESVDIDNNATVRGPAYDAGAGVSSFEDGPAKQAQINGTLTFNGNAGNGTNNTATVTGFTITADDSSSSVVDLSGGAGNVTIANTSISAVGNATTGLPESLVRGVEIADASNDATVSTVNLTGLYVGDHDAVQTLNTSVYVDDTVDLTVSDSEFVGRTPATANRTANGTGLNITDTTAAENATVTVTSSTIKNFAQAGVDATASRNSTKYDSDDVGPIVLSGTTIENNDGAGVVAAGNITRSVTVNETSTVTNNDIGVHANNENVTINVLESTVSAQNGTNPGIRLDDAANDSSINGTAVVNNDIGLLVDAEFNGLDVTNNNFTNPTDIRNTGSTTLNATLNYFGNSNVSVNDDAGTTTIYDPMLSKDLTGDYQTDVSDTTNFAHDIEVPANTVITVGFPSAPAADYEDVDEAFRFDEISSNTGELALYELNDSTQQLDPLFQSSDGATEIEANDAFMIWNARNTSFSAGQITYSDPRPGTVPDPYVFDEKGVHFVAPSGYGNASTALVDGSGGDMITTGINTKNGSNLYGVADQTNTTFSGSGTADLDSTYVDTFKETAGNRTVHPHRGYFVIVSEDSTVETRLQGSGTIRVGEAPTAANIDDKLNQSAS